MAAPMNSVELEGGTRRYRARYRDVAGRQHEKRFRQEVCTQRWLDEQASALVTQTWPGTPAPP
ncbi:hypothetical protein [Geodermatophilus amargosae]|uniref:hypothetical protein n=1 Tax=Geodermatophilus amargosae TaxID=1296565 RepID=UPI0034DE556F